MSEKFFRETSSCPQSYVEISKRAEATERPTFDVFIEEISLFGGHDFVVDAPASGGNLTQNAGVLTVHQRVSA